MKTKNNLTGGVWAAIIAMLGLMISVMTGYLESTWASNNYIFLGGYAVLCVAMIKLIYLREVAIKIDADEAEKVYFKKQEELTTILKTMPPVHALIDFSNSHKQLLNTYRGLRAESEYDSIKNPIVERKLACEVDRVIRIALDSLCQLFAHYNHKPNGGVFSANIMLYYTVNDIKHTEELYNHVKEVIRFVNNKDKPLDCLDGVLLLDTELSASTKQAACDAKDDQIKQIALPIPTKDSDPSSHRSRYIPVAPRAFKEDRIYYPDTKVLLTQMEKDNWEILPECREELEEYFRSEGSKRIGSILSLRLKSEMKNDKSITWGVINIHSNTRNGMDQGMIHSYIHIARPMFELIKDLLIIR